MMSGIDEVKKLWVLEYQEWIIEDYIYSYRGIQARNKEEAEMIGKMIVEYFNLNYNTSDDEENLDYCFVKIHSMTENNPFILSDEELVEMQKYVLWNREER